LFNRRKRTIVMERSERGGLKIIFNPRPSQKVEGEDISIMRASLGEKEKRN